MSPHRIIIVAGSPRSGTTAVGDLLSIGRSVGSLYEPLNFHVGCRQINRYFEFPGQDGFSVESLESLVDGVKGLTLSFKRGGFPEDRGWKGLVKDIVGGRPYVTYLACKINPFLKTVVWKDPFVSFLCGYLAEKHGIPSLVTLRSPWAVAGSFKRLGWSFDLERIAVGAGKLGFVFDDLKPYFVVGDDSPVKNAALLWAMLYSSVLQSLDKSSLVNLVDLDQVVSNPVETYEKLYRQVGLMWTPSVAEKIRRFYSGSEVRSSEPRSGVAHDWKRDFSQVNRYYRKLLTPDEISFVTEVCGNAWESAKGKCL